MCLFDYKGILATLPPPSPISLTAPMTYTAAITTAEMVSDNSPNHGFLLICCSTSTSVITQKSWFDKCKLLGCVCVFAYELKKATVLHV